MKNNRRLAIIIAFIMTFTMSTPTFAFAEDSIDQNVGVENTTVTNEAQRSANTGNVETETPVEEFNYSIENGEVTIDSYVGARTEVVIPKNIEGLPVTRIEQNAFYECSGISRITIPEGVTNIGFFAFERCSNLISITIPNGVTSIEDMVFAHCSSLSSITIPKGATSIGEAAFYGCSSLSNVTIPEGVTSIGHRAFSGCSKLEEIKLPGSLVSIGDSAFGSQVKLIVYENSFGREYAVAKGMRYEIDANEIKAESIKLNKKGLEIEVGESFKLMAELLPENTTQKRIKWRTDNNNVISINEDGTIEGLEPGVAIVTATTAYGLTATCEVSVTNIHSWDDGTIIQNVGCDDDEVIEYKCTGCLKTKTKVTANALGHNWKKGDVLIAPGCETEGKREIICERCNCTSWESISPTGHSYSEELTYDNKMHWNECHCGAKENETVHNWHSDYRIIKDAKCLEEGSKAIFCKDCNAKKDGSEVKVDALGHAYGVVNVKPTCSEAGYDLQICGRCGDINKINVVIATGHVFGEWQTIKNSTCTEEGSEQRKCSDCKYTEARTIVKKEHHWESDYTIDKHAECAEDGSKSIHCRDCDAVKDITVIDAVGHDFSDYIIDKTASFETDGTLESTCSKCSERKTKVIPKVEKPALSTISYTYDGKTKEPKVTLKNSLGDELSAGTDYAVTYKNNKYVGVAKAIITGKGNYSGTITKTFKINPPKTSITSLSKSKKAFTVKWTKKTSQVTGYQIMYARNSKFTSSKKTVTVTSYKTTSKKITKLLAKKKYYVKVRTYKTVKGVKYYSPWSSYKTVTTK